MRKLARIAIIDDIIPHPNADLLELAIVEGWQCVVKKGDFRPNDVVIYLEVDSVIPVSEEFEFLRKCCYVQRSWLSISEGFRLKTIKLRKEISQGLVVPVFDRVKQIIGYNQHNPPIGLEITDILGVVKWEPPLPVQLAGKARGNFPSFISKTDQERAQNLKRFLFNEDNQKNQQYEVTVKLDGSSMTCYVKDGLSGVCSRNIDLVVEENSSNSFVQYFIEHDIGKSLEQLGKNIAIQGELCGPNIQGNKDKLDKTEFFVFDIFDIDTQQYLGFKQRMDLLKQLSDIGCNLKHVPVLYTDYVFNFSNMNDLLKFAEGPSLNSPIREGVVFKRNDGQFSFKVISNSYLLGVSQDDQ